MDLSGSLASLALSPTSSQLDALRAYAALLDAKAISLGMLGPSERERIEERHIVDSARAARAIRLTDRSAYDLGSGAGLPGIVIAILAPFVAVRLVEARARRAAFLELVVDSLRLANATVIHGRVEELQEAVDVVTARAFSGLSETWRLARPLLRPGGRLVYFAGRSLRDPLEVAAAAARAWGGATASLDRVLATGPPLVMMTRSDDGRERLSRP